MTTSAKRARTLQVSDVMSQEAISVSVNDTMAEAANVLCSHEVSGVPVVDEMGHCVGVLSTKDFAERVQNEHPASLATEGDCNYSIIASKPDSSMLVERFKENSVRQHMQSAVQTVSASTSVVDAAKIMTSEHIHRLVVLDETSRPVGVASSLDLLKALVKELSSH